MFPILLWKDLGNIYFSVAVLSPSSSPSDVVRSCNVVCLSANGKKTTHLLYWWQGLNHSLLSFIKVRAASVQGCVLPALTGATVRHVL